MILDSGLLFWATLY